MARRVFIVTGGNKGIGFETAKKICKELKNEDATVVITSRSPENGAQAVAKLAGEGLKVEMVQLDIAHKLSREMFVETIRNKYGQVECLVNNAGFAFKNDATEPVGVQARMTCGINYYGTRDLTKAMTSLFTSGSRIVNVASMAGQRALTQMTPERRHRLMSKSATLEDIDSVVEEYLADCATGRMDGWPSTTYGFSKAAVIAMTAALARMSDKCPALKDREGMVVTCCCPGWCKTDMAGWEAPPLSAADGAEIVGSLALGATKEHHGKFIQKEEVHDLRED
ncbi:carbonyl reductase [NADPH] 1 [Cyclospora cayetanensis]|uniref:Uncharacterized protein n=2 Tax=Cyclospora cayetanensis TaxID=88456 RepID=A0A1D3D0D5_9EIME|nr:carbonyl reductase [NADPH] 1 [Cyclospora cayetanensis]OEH76902.1 hypothetical protein cyc_07228 [Cyclospora cayetanensis]